MYTPIELDKTRNLRYGMAAISIIEKKFKKTISKIDFNDLSMYDTATIIWAGLVHEDRKLTVENVIQLVDDHSNIKTVVETMGKAFQDSFGGENKEEKN